VLTLWLTSIGPGLGWVLRRTEPGV
jgi:hypothetical protein